MTQSEPATRSSPEAQDLEPIAVVGIGCRFPGASDWRELWSMLRDGRDAITEIPLDRFDIEAFYDPRPGMPGRTASRWGGVLAEVDGFDASFFGIAPREAVYIDPQQRLLLEVGWEALEDAGENPDRLAGSATGVFIGETSSDYGELVAADPSRINSVYMVTGSGRGISSGRLSFVLDLRGPSVTVDTACSSSLLAVHLACQSIWHGESTMAFAGGVNLVLVPHGTVGFSQAGMAAADGRCKAFSANGDGFVRSDGIGVVLLKPLSQAQSDGNTMYAVIRGTGANNDGQSSGLLMTPGQEGQEAALGAAYRQAGVDPRHVSYVEAHGTGTVAGDPVEMAALVGVLGAGRSPERPCLVGSLKTNIGHTEAASGVAGLIKTALCLHHRAIPASLHSTDLNPAIDWDAIPFEVPQGLTEWPPTGRALAGVNSFGISGSNVHVVLEAAPANAGPAATTADRRDLPMLLPLSARSSQAVVDLAAVYAGFLADAYEHDTALADICASACMRRAHHEHRLAVVARTPAEAAAQLASIAEAGTESPPQPSGGGAKRKIVFVFPGQGGQWRGMGRLLLADEPVFASALHRCAEAMSRYIDWSLIEQISADQEDSDWSAIDRVQPTLFAVQVALSELWRSWGIEPDAVIGHSMGEVAAAHIAGALSLDDATRVICRRGALLTPLRGRGAMALVALSMEEAAEALIDCGDRLSIAVCNSPVATVVSGEPGALASLVAELESRGVFCRIIDVDFASHSPQIDDLKDDLQLALAGVSPRPGTLPIYSTVTGLRVDGSDYDGDYWFHNLRQPVLFAPAITQAADDGHSVFVEINPSPILSGAVLQICRDRWPGTAVITSTRRDENERAALLEALGRMYCLGASVAWDALHPESSPAVALPRYPWQHQRFWAETADHWKSGRAEAGMASPRRRSDGALAHPLLGRPFRSGSRPELHSFETEIGPHLMSYLNDHRVQDIAVFPAAGYLEMAFAAAEEVLGSPDVELFDVSFSNPLVLEPAQTSTIRLELNVEGHDQASFGIFSMVHDSLDEAPTAHVSGTLRLLGDKEPTDQKLDADRIRARCPDVLSGVDYYETLERAGLTYGPCFRGVEEVWRGQGEALGSVQLPKGLESEVGRYLMHPAQLDACLQVLAASIPRQTDGLAVSDTYVPASLGRIRLWRAPGPRLLSYARMVPDDRDSDRVAGDVTVIDDAGRVVLSVQGLGAVRIDRAQRGGHGVAGWMYTLDWERTVPLQDRPPGPDARPTASGERWMVLSDQRGVGSALIASLESEGARCIEVSHGRSGLPLAPGRHELDPSDVEAWQSVLEEANATGPLSGIVHLWSLDIPEPDALTAAALRADQALACTSVMRLIQALPSLGTHLAPRLVLVTAGAQAPSDDATEISVAQAPLWGMGRALDYEHPELACTLVDLSDAGDADEESAALCRELHAGSGETQILLRGQDRYVARMVPPGEALASARARAVNQAPVVAAHGEPVTLRTRSLGILDNLEWLELPRRAPGPGEVEIGVCAVGLNFNDVLGALGVSLGHAQGGFAAGYECSGRVVAVGEGVSDVKVGDEVIAVAHPCFGNYVTTLSCLVVPKPAGLSFEQAAALPVAYVTAHHALCGLARLASGERLLIHAAAGGVGLAAVHIAKALGAEIFATAGSPEKRALLNSLGVEHVFDSRTLDFADQIRAATGGRGVDVVLNSLAGAAIERSLETLATFGRFVEIGKRDLYEHNRRIGLHNFQKSLSFFTVDLKRLGEERPAAAGDMLREAMSFFRDRGLAPLPIRSYDPDDVVDAFRYMSQARHIGKIVIGFEGRTVAVTPTPGMTFTSDATYLIAGGMGGLGMVVARWMVEQGARTLVLLGRSNPSASVQQQVETMAELGATIIPMAADITDEDQVREILGTIKERLPPLRGVIHSAAVLDDGIAIQLTEERLISVLAPKVLGAWNLHRHTREEPLDFFVLFSSAAGMFGSPGQANYCAANSFLDALSHLRASQGLPSLSIAWGAWADVGLAAERDDRGKRLARRGLGSMTPEEGVEALGEILGLAAPYVAVVPFDYQRWCEFYPRARTEAVFTRLREAQGAWRAPASAVGKAIRAAEPSERGLLIERYLSERAAKILGFAEAQVDAQRSLQSLGLDSLMAVELCNAIEVELGVAVPSMNFLKGDSVGELAQLISHQMLASVDAAPSTEPGIDHLSDREVEDLLQALELEATTDTSGQ